MFFTSVSGCTDHFSGTEEEAFETSRQIVTTFNIDVREPPSARGDIKEPLYDADDICGLIPAEDQHTMDAYQVPLKFVQVYMYHV